MPSAFSLTGDAAKPLARNNRANLIIGSVRVAAHPQREMIAIIANGENLQSAEWQEENHLDLKKLTVPEKDVSTIPVPGYALSHHLPWPWEMVRAN